MLPKRGQSSNLLKLITIAFMSAISLVLMFINFPLPFLPQYLKIDFSEVPALVAALIFSPLAGIAVEGIKNLLFLAYTGDVIGVIANFFAGMLFILPVSMIYHKFKSTKSIVSGLVTGTIIMAVGMSVLNYFFILPAYAWFLGMEEMNSAQVKWITVTAGILPFNAMKGIILGALFVPFYLKLQSWLNHKQTYAKAS
ncbi:riboflavin transporter FmnP [Pontibacillus halophilus JSM 076056 = DSM 19796]|uniref:Riboflavin transporter n=2 Tax=Pontibacillus TaxID=289201 RepID=A0A0A5GEI6_9BACI|nr:riboflavin transporter FmnP [Pontibacillus halophilus JSM 076056 = DSM 19796]